MLAEAWHGLSNNCEAIISVYGVVMHVNMTELGIGTC